MEMLAQWLADDTPTPQVFCDLITGQCEMVSKDEFEERERICGACQITAREEGERREKMKARRVHWEDGSGGDSDL